MKWVSHLIFLVCYLTATKSSFSDFIASLKPHEPAAGLNNDEQLKQLQKTEEWGKKWNFKENKVFDNPYHLVEEDAAMSETPDAEHFEFVSVAATTSSPPKILPKILEIKLKNELEDASPEIPKIEKKYYEVDPILNLMRSDLRRQGDSGSGSASSSREMKTWKEEFREDWLHKKFEALNQTLPSGDLVNVVAARPWGVSCGDPNQHDMPWGSCMLAAECEAEYRIYRGDAACGRTQFVCCALKINIYDMYQGFDISLDDKSMSTDSDEKKDKTKSSKEQRQKKAARDRKKRKKDREERKKKIQRNIKKIIKEITKLLNKQFRNGTKERKRRTKQLKKFLKHLKKQYRHDRDSIKDLDEKIILFIDKHLMDRLNQIKAMNQRFIDNETFRNMVLQGTMTKQGARMLLEAYPELASDLKLPAARTRRAGGDDDPVSLEYDIEYGYLYY